MKVYRVNEHGTLVSAEVPDGAICMEIGAPDDSIIDDGYAGMRDMELSAIDAVDWEGKTYRRKRWTKSLPFPEKYYRIEDVEWTEVAK